MPPSTPGPGTPAAPPQLRAFKCPLCDFEVKARDVDELVEFVQSHGRRFHDFRLTREEILRMAQVVPD